MPKPWHAIEGHGRDQLSQALSWIGELTPWDGARLTVDFVRRHPRVVLDVLRRGGA